MNTPDVSSNYLTLLEKIIQKRVKQFGYNVKVRLIRNSFFYNNWVVYYSGETIDNPEGLKMYLLKHLNRFLVLSSCNEYFQVRNIRLKSFPRP
jgi:hypothetical protein